MKIVFTGGSSGGHFYPLMAVAKEVRDIAYRERLVEPKLYYVGPFPFDERILFENGIVYVKVSAGKVRRYFSIQNILDIPKTIIGIIHSVFVLYKIYPDVIFSKGSYASIPIVTAGWLLRIPIVIHESDSTPGRANKWAGRFATAIAVSYPSAAAYFKGKEVAVTGNPVREDIKHPITDGSYEAFSFESETPVILVLGGSQGAHIINESVINALPKLIEDFQVLHQVGEKNMKEVEELSRVVLYNNEKQHRYKPLAYMDAETLQRAAGIARLVISRAGSTIFEIAYWGKPSLIIPIPEDVSHDQHSNAFAYARTGAAHVIEGKNLTSSILVAEIQKILSDIDLYTSMSKAAKAFSKEGASQKIAKKLIAITLEHTEQ